MLAIGVIAGGGALRGLIAGFLSGIIGAVGASGGPGKINDCSLLIVSYRTTQVQSQNNLELSDLRL